MITITTPTQVRFSNLVRTKSRKYVNTQATLMLSIFTATVLVAVTTGAIATYPDPAKAATGTDLQSLLLGVTLTLTAVIAILSVTSGWT